MPSQKDAIFGKLAVERGYLTQEQLDEAFEVQRRMRDELGVDESLDHVLVAKHWLTADQAQEVRNAAAVKTGEARLVAGYEVISRLGKGGMGAVYRARRIGTPDFVALKILPPSLANEGMIARFRRESEIVRKLDHDNIVGCVEFGFDKRRKCHFCALELIEGEDLGKRIPRLGKLSEDEAVSITRQIASALQHAFFNGLVHRDVKPENVMVTADGTAKLLDLGLARPANQEATRLTESGMFVGSPYYASPEQALGEKEVDIRSDIYSLGATLYHMVTGRPPFEGTTALAILQKHVTEKLPWPAEVNPELSDGLCRIIAKMMQKAPDDRYQTPNDLHRDLDLLVAGEEPEVQDAALKNSSVKVPAVRPKRRRRPGARGRAGHRRREAIPLHGRRHEAAGGEAPEKASGWSTLPTVAKIGIPAAVALLVALGLGLLFLGREKPDRGPPKAGKPQQQPGTAAKVPPPTARERKKLQPKAPQPPVVKPKPASPGPTLRTVPGPEPDKKADEEYFAKLRRESEEREARLRELAKTVTATGRDEPYEQDPGPDGLILIEAEGFSAKADAGVHRWEPVTGPKGYSGKGVMKASPDRRVQLGSDDVLARSPRLDYRIEFVKTGVHYLWVRMYGSDWNADSCHAGIDGSVTMTDVTGNVAHRYHWERRRKHTWPLASFKVPALGIHTVSIWMREDGTIVDAIAVTTNPKWTPAGIIPLSAAETERGDRAELGTLLAEFDTLVQKGDYAAAEKRIGGTAGEERFADFVDEIAAAVGVCEALDAKRNAVRQAVEGQLGKEIELRTTKGKLAGNVALVTDEGVDLAIKKKLRGAGTIQTRMNIKWADLAPEQEDRLAWRGGWKCADADAHIALAYLALGRKDMLAAGRALREAGGHPLAGHVRGKIETLSKPGKKARARKPRTPAPTLTLDLGGGVKMEFVYIKPGVFTMGGESTTEGRFQAVETPKHTVTITKGFYLGKYEVTQAQYQTIMGQNPSLSTKAPNCPVDNVSWQNAKEFCRRVARRTGLKVRLPTEAEWEYACRAGTDTPWSHGSDPAKLTEYAWIAGNSGRRSHPVGQKKPNPWGLHDIHGNVCERVADMYHRDYYAHSPKEDPTGARVAYAKGDNGTTILRGGTWKGDADACRSGARMRGGGNHVAYHNWGFRAAVSATAAGPSAKPARAIDLTRGLVGWWKFDEGEGNVASDSSGRGNDGRIQGARWVRGRAGGALYFDGNGVVTTDLGGFNSDFTWAVWIKTSNQTGAIVANSEQTWSRGAKAFYVFGGKPKVDVGWAGFLRGRTVVNDGQWHHMAVTAKFETAGANDTVKIYVDSELDATKADWDINRAERNHRIRIGHVAHEGKYFTGLIDGVRVYKRALSAAEVKALAASK